MVFLATTRRGYESFMTLNAAAALWLSAGLLTADELRVPGAASARAHAGIVVIAGIRRAQAGAVITENVFGRPGIGQVLVNAVNTRDIPTVSGIVLVIAAVGV